MEPLPLPNRTCGITASGSPVSILLRTGDWRVPNVGSLRGRTDPARQSSGCPSAGGPGHGPGLFLRAVFSGWNAVFPASIHRLLQAPPGSHAGSIHTSLAGSRHCGCPGSFRCFPPRLEATRLLQVLSRSTVPAGRGFSPRRMALLRSARARASCPPRRRKGAGEDGGRARWPASRRPAERPTARQPRSARNPSTPAILPHRPSNFSFAPPPR